MKKQKLSICAIVMTALVLLFGALKNVLPSVHIFPAIDTVISPLLCITALVCAYFVFRDTVAIPGKWVWVVIAMQFALALHHFQEISYNIFICKAPVLQIVAPVVYAAGFTCILLALLNKKLWKLLTVGLGVLALASLLSPAITLMTPVEFLLYAFLALAAQSFPSVLCKLFRIIAVVLAVVGFGTLGAFAVVGWVIFAFILVPAKKSPCRFSLAKFTAVLCIITALFVLAAFIAGSPLDAIESRNRAITATKESIAENENQIVTLTADIKQYKTDLETAKTTLAKEQEALTAANAELTKAQADLQVADDELDKVCTWSYYSWWCNASCLPLHDAVNSCSDVVNAKRATATQFEDSVRALENTIKKTEAAIKQAELDITTAKENIAALTKQLKELVSLLSVDWFVLSVQLAALALTVAALVCFAICLFKAAYGRLALIACGAMAAGSLLCVLVGTVFRLSSAPVWLYLLTSPHTWSTVIAALFAAILARKQRCPVKYRVLAVIAAVITAVLSAASGVGVLYAVTMICVAFVLVPVVFTEYNSVAKHLFLTFITLGLWQLIWTYHVTKNLNKVSGTETRKPGLTLLLCLILPFYYTYWLLKTGENVEAYALENGKQCKLDILCLVFAFICPLISTVLIQNKINMIVGKPE